jgi:hypothetical protein
MNGREIALMVPIVLGCLAIGLFPQPLIKTAEPEIKYVAELAKEARTRNKPSESARQALADREHRTANVQRPTPNGQGREGALNVERRTPNGERRVSALDVQRSTFNVRRSTFIGAALDTE